MKKFLSGIIVGALIFGAVPGVYAASKSLVGKKIATEMAVYFNGKKLEDSAIVTEGKSYLPVRKIAELSGLTLNLKGNDIFLKSKEAVITENTPTPTPTLSPALKQDYEERLKTVLQGIKDVEAELGRLEAAPVAETTPEMAAILAAERQKAIDAAKKTLQTLYANKADCEEKLGITPTTQP